MEKLSSRLQTILKMVDQDAIVADVGSDHGKLMISLWENGIISKGYAIENKKGPYNRLEKALIANGLKDKVTPLFSDGITDLPIDVDTVVIAGMGGRTIIDIIKSHLEKISNVKTFIIDAHSCIPEVRKEIVALGYSIAREEILLEDGIFYEIIKFNRGVSSYNEDDYEFGPLLRKDSSKTFKLKYQYRINEIDIILAKESIPSFVQNKLKEEKEKLLKVINYEN